MNIPSLETRGIVSLNSSDATPSPNYIGYWPMTQWTGAVGALASDVYTAAATSVVDTTNNYVTGVTAETWLVAGAAFRVRSTGSLAGGLAATTTYYASKPDADKVKFHTTYADAIAGTNAVDISSQGTNNIVLYPGVVVDRSGQGNDMQFGANNNDTVIWGTAPWLSGSSSGSADQCVGVLDLTTLNARWVWPTHSLVAFFRFRPGTLVPGRSIWGCGVSTSVHGPAILLDSTTGAKARIAFCGGTTAITVGDTSATAIELNTEHSIGVAFDASARTATAWVDGVRDLTVSDVSIASAGTVLPTTGIRIGGRSATNCHAGGFRDYHLLSIEGGLPSNIDTIIARLHTSMHCRLRSTDI